MNMMRGEDDHFAKEHQAEAEHAVRQDHMVHCQKIATNNELLE
jgi:hypothetical protein